MYNLRILLSLFILIIRLNFEHYQETTDTSEQNKIKYTRLLWPKLFTSEFLEYFHDA